MPNILEKKNNLNEKEPSLNNLNQATEEKPKGLVSILGSLVPFAPALFEQVTGQKVPLMTGTLGEMQNNLAQLTLTQSQLTSYLTQVLDNQKQIFQRIVSLESNASQQILSLDKRLDGLTSVRLTHEKERKQIEYQAKRDLKEENLAEIE